MVGTFPKQGALYEVVPKSSFTLWECASFLAFTHGKAQGK